MSPEHRGRRRPFEPNRASQRSEPLTPIPLPPELAEFLLTTDVACLLHGSGRGTTMIIKIPAAEIASVRGRVPIGFRHELYDHPNAPVIRLVTTIHDRPESALSRLAV